MRDQRGVGGVDDASAPTANVWVTLASWTIAASCVAAHPKTARSCARRLPFSAFPTSWSTLSPTRWPRLSLMPLKRSMSASSTAHGPCCSSAASRPSSMSWNAERLRSPVSASRWVWSRRRTSVAAFVRHVAECAPRSSNVSASDGFDKSGSCSRRSGSRDDGCTAINGTTTTSSRVPAARRPSVPTNPAAHRVAHGVARRHVLDERREPTEVGSG